MLSQLRLLQLQLLPLILDCVLFLFLSSSFFAASINHSSTSCLLVSVLLLVASLLLLNYSSFSSSPQHESQKFKVKYNNLISSSLFFNFSRSTATVAVVAAEEYQWLIVFFYSACLLVQLVVCCCCHRVFLCVCVVSFLSGTKLGSNFDTYVPDNCTRSALFYPSKTCTNFSAIGIFQLERSSFIPQKILKNYQLSYTSVFVLFNWLN